MVVVVIVFEGLVQWTGNKPKLDRTERKKTEPVAVQPFEIEKPIKTAPNRTDKNRLQPVQNGGRYSL